MKKYKIGFNVFGQMVWLTIEAVSRTAAQAKAYEKMEKSKKTIKEVVEL